MVKGLFLIIFPQLNLKSRDSTDEIITKKFSAKIIQYSGYFWLTLFPIHELLEFWHTERIACDPISSSVTRKNDKKKDIERKGVPPMAPRAF
jgi:hypothetical protein